MPTTLESSAARPNKEAVLTTAVLRAADKLGVKGKHLSSVLGLSETTLSRMKKGTHFLEADTKPFEFGVLSVRLFRPLDAIVGGDEAASRPWLANPNIALGGRPADEIRTIAGLTDVIAYLDASRAVV